MMLAITYYKKFMKDLADITSASRKEIEHFIFEILPTFHTLAEANRFEKMTGYRDLFKARFGDYRIGVHYINNRLELRRVLHRKEIYRFFP